MRGCRAIIRVLGHPAAAFRYSKSGSRRAAHKLPLDPGDPRYGERGDRAQSILLRSVAKANAHLARMAHRLSAAPPDPAVLTTFFSTFDLDVFQHAVARKPSKKYRHTNRLRRLATKPGELSGLAFQ